VFKAENPDHERGIAEGWKPKPLRFVDMPLHGIWGQGVPGRLQVRGRCLGERGAGYGRRPVPYIGSDVFVRWARPCLTRCTAGAKRLAMRV
jgi:hypothetical protein